MRKYPIAEIFTSPQGEGVYTGVLMTFIRFAGCSVGKKMTEAQRAEWNAKLPQFAVASKDWQRGNNELQVYTEQCETAWGTKFCCDTNFQTKEVLTMDQILDRVPEGVEHLCFTGGEPLDQPLEEFIEYVGERTDFTIHVETSGTVNITERAFPDWQHGDGVDNGGFIWITVSPKRGVLPEMIINADEIKLLVDDSFSVDSLPVEILAHPMVYIQPINFEWAVNEENLKRCIEIQKLHPLWRISTQAHKLWGVR